MDFEPSDAASTGQVMQFRVVPAAAPDPTTPPQYLVLPVRTPLPAATFTRPLALVEKSAIGFDADGQPVEGPATMTHASRMPMPSTFTPTSATMLGPRYVKGSASAKWQAMEHVA